MRSGERKRSSNTLEQSQAAEREMDEWDGGIRMVVVSVPKGTKSSAKETGKGFNYF